MQVCAKTALIAASVLILALSLAFFSCFLALNVLYDSDSYMLSEFIRTDVPFFSGIPSSELIQLNEEVRSFIKGERDSLKCCAKVKNEVKEVFSPDEKSHLTDVRELYLEAKKVFWAAGIILVVFLFVSLKSDKIFLLNIVKSVTVTAVFIPVLVAAFFDKAFIMFHKIFFPGGNWSFDIQKSIMVNIYTQSFFEKLFILMCAGNLIICMIIFIFAFVKIRKIGSVKENG